MPINPFWAKKKWDYKSEASSYVVKEQSQIMYLIAKVLQQIYYAIYLCRCYSFIHLNFTCDLPTNSGSMYIVNSLRIHTHQNSITENL